MQHAIYDREVDTGRAMMNAEFFNDHCIPVSFVLGKELPLQCGPDVAVPHARKLSYRNGARRVSNDSCSRLAMFLPLWPCRGRFSVLVVPDFGTFLCRAFPGHGFGPIPASCSFASSAFPVPPQKHCVPSHKAAARLGSRSPRFWVPQEN